LRDRSQPLQSRCCRAGQQELRFLQRVTNRIASTSGMERPAIEGDSPVGESVPTLDRVPEYHVEGLSCGKPGGPPSKAKYSWRPIVDKYREGKVKSTPGGE
jgi:hypothetical protein